MLVVGLLCAACVGSGGVGRDGPLTGLDGLGSATDNYRVGQRFAAGLGVIFNPLDHPIVIETVRPVPGDGSLRFLGASVAGFERTVGNTDLVDWPVMEAKFGRLEDADGYVFQPGERASTMGVELLVGYEVTEEGRSTVRGIEIEYRVGENHFREQFQVTLAVCVAESMADGPQEDCAFEERDAS